VLHALPLFGFFAGPFKFLYVALFLVHVLAAVGLERIAVARAAWRRLAVAAVALAAVPSVGWPALLGMAAAALPERALAAAVTAIVLGAGASFFAQTAPLATPQPFSRDAFTPLLRASPADAAASPADRWIALDEDAALRLTGMNFGALWGLQAISGVGPLPPWREFEVLGAAEAGRAPALVREVGASRVVVRAGSGLERGLVETGLRRVGGLDGLGVLAVPSPPPSIFLARTIERVTAATAVAAARRGEALDVDRVLVEAAPEGTTEAGDPAGGLDVLAAAPTAYRMRVELDRPTWMIARVPYYRNWHATIDDHPTDVRPAGAMFLAVRADKGRHDISLRYTEPGLIPGMAIAAATALILGILRAKA
jgi:hypothetical protein